MTRHLWLRDLELLPITLDGVYEKYNFTNKEVAAARTKLAKRGLRFDNLTGHTRDNEGIVEQFRRYMTGTPEQMENPATWVLYTSEDDVMQWEFRRNVLSEAARERNRIDPLHTSL